MVCIPCIIAPVLLFVWYRFIQPIVLKFWNPWAPQKAVKNSQTKESEKSSCPFANKTEAAVTQEAVKNSQTKESEKSSCPFANKTELEPVQSTEVMEKETSSKKCD